MKRTSAFLAGLLLVASVAVAQTVPGAPWSQPEVANFELPLQNNVRSRPSVKLETDRYVYGSAQGLDPFPQEVNLSINSHNFNGPVTLYFYWHNRANGNSLYFNLPAGGFVNQEVDLFGTADRPVSVLVPDLDELQLIGPNGVFGELPAEIPTSVGRYQFVFEIRNGFNGEEAAAPGTQVLARNNSMYNQVSGVVPVSGNIGAGTTWTSNNLYILATPVNVQAGATLNIEPGTVIFGSTAGEGTLVIRTGATINANGNEMDPIVFSSEQPVGQRAPGDWGGLVINGTAPTNQQNPEGEGNSGPYGGNNPNDSSGVLRYVRVEFAGIRFSDQNELNGIAFQGVGAGTQVDHIQVLFNQDDGVEFFGGTVNAKFVLVVGALDDSLDWTFGWTGKLQHFVAIQRGGEANNGIEADNFEDNPDLTPRSAPQIANATFIGQGGACNNLGQGCAETGAGLLLRRGTAGFFRNFIVQGFGDVDVDVDEAETEALLGQELTLDNSFFFNNGLVDGGGDDNRPAVLTWLQQTQTNNTFANPGLTFPFDDVMPNVELLPGVPARSAGANLPNDGFFDQVGYVGGVNPGNSWLHEAWVNITDN